MYLDQIYIENNGPLDHFEFELPFTDEGLPKPVVLVGGNGSGKTNLLSIIADGLISSAGKYYTDVLSGMSPIQTPYFRVVGSRTVRVGAAGSLAIMRFQHNNTAFFFKEKAGSVPVKEAKARLPETLQAAAIWKDDDNVKDVNLPEKVAQAIFSKGVYVYFPSSRAETVV